MADQQHPDPAQGSGEVFCIGNALLDISFIADEKFLKEFKLKPNDSCTMDAPTFQVLFDALEKRYHATGVPGGSSQNVARTIQWLLPDPPGTVTYFGAVCNDHIGNLLIENATHSGINGVYDTVETPTGCCIVIVTGKHHENRSLAAILGGAQTYSIEHLEKYWSLVMRSKIVFISGYFLPTCLEACEKLGNFVATSKDRTLAMALSACYISTDHKDKLEKVLPFVDILFGNHDEFEAFAKAFKISGGLESIAKAASCLHKVRASPPRVVVITHGDKPVLVASSGAVQKFPIPKMKVKNFVDRNGSGDAFVGGFLAQALRGKSLEDCVKCGAATATITLQNLGCTFPKDKPVDIDNLASLIQ